MEVNTECCGTFSDKCVDRLKSHGHRITKSRVAITEFLEGHDSPFTAKEVYLYMQEQGLSSLDFATVYRTLQTYADLELIHMVQTTGRYIKCNSKHVCHAKSVHIIYTCDTCKKIEEHQLDQDLVGSIFFMTKQISPDFVTKGMVLELTGQCGDCVEQANH